jgi:hypothetical protein
MDIIKLTADGVARVFEGKEGMTFVVHDTTPGVTGANAHVRDYRYPNAELGREYQIWTIGPTGYAYVSG